MKKQTKRLAVSGILCALGVVILWVGAILEVLDLSAAALSSFCILFATVELGGIYPPLIFGVTSLLSFLLLPVKLPALYYLLFFGWYPILKKQTAALPRLLALPVRLLFFLCSLTLVIATSRLLFSNAETAFVTFGIWVYAGGLLVFFLYDLALSRITATYIAVWRKKWKIRF